MPAPRLDRTPEHLPGDRIVLEHRGRATTAGELDALVARAAAALAARGCGRGDRVALVLPRGLPFIALHLACLRSGLVSTPCHPAATEAELAHITAEASPRLLLREAEAQALLAAVPHAAPEPSRAAQPPCADETALLLFTSGTTGRPKGVPLTHGQIEANLAALAAAWEWSGSDVLLHVLPLFHVHGLIVALHGALRAGARTLLLDAFDAQEVAVTLAARGCTLFMGVPTMVHRLAQLPRGPGLPDRLPALRLALCGSAPLRPGTAQAFRARFGVPIIQRYGMTEALMITSQPLRETCPPLSVGRALPGVELAIVDRATRQPLPAGSIGEVLVRGPGVFHGYWGAPAPGGPDALGWLATGDLGWLDAEGWLLLAGRARELIICGGFNIYPREVESVLDGHPDVAESAVFGLPDADLGETIAAAVVPAPGRAPTVQALLAHCRVQLAPTKCPRVLALLDALPRNAMGKVQKQLLPARPEFAGQPPAREPPLG
jgi:malonyl-CoA/methylmalonyl-CoA synthetase